MTQFIDEFYVIGISVKTTNENKQSAIDIPQLWEQFFRDDIAEKIPNKVSDSVYCLYTGYEGDYTAPYVTIIGCRVVDLSEVPVGLTGSIVMDSTYTVVTAKGNLNEGLVINEWIKIWDDKKLQRAYKTDFEVYGDNAKNSQDAEVKIYLSIR